MVAAIVFTPVGMLMVAQPAQARGLASTGLCAYSILVPVIAVAASSWRKTIVQFTLAIPLVWGAFLVLAASVSPETPLDGEGFLLPGLLTPYSVGLSGLARIILDFFFKRFQASQKNGVMIQKKGRVKTRDS